MKDFLKRLFRIFSNRLSNREVIGVLAVLILVITVVLTVSVSQKKQTFRPDAEEPTTPACQVQSLPLKMPVLVLKYFPLDNSGSRLDLNIVGMSEDLSVIRSKVDNLTQTALQTLGAASSYHGYKTTNEPFLQYSILDSKEYLEALPISANKVPWHANDPNPTYRPDYYQIANDINICDYVDNRGVKEVWLWGYHHGKIEPVEADQAMGTDSRKFWNHGSYGNVSNSEQINDLPVCKKTYTLYNYDYNRGLGEMLENHGHQIEEVLKYVDPKVWSEFRYPYGELAPAINSCGWIHSGPNTKIEYQLGWANETTVKSNCEDWHPDGSGEVKDINCHTWYGTSCFDDSGVKFKVWWMQNIPGYNNGIVLKGQKMRNWWEAIYDFDSFIEHGRSLYGESLICMPTPSPTPTPTLSPTPTFTPTPTPISTSNLIISTAPNVTVTSNSVTITWETNKPSSSLVNYGVSSRHRKSTVEINTNPLVLLHSVEILNLKDCTVYHYEVVSKDEGANSAASNDQFATTGCNASVVSAKEKSDIVGKTTGGEVSFLDTSSLGIKLSIPKDFADTGSRFQILKLNNTEYVEKIAPPPGLNIVGGYVYSLNAFSEDDDVEVDVFKKGITVTMQYKDSDLAGIDEKTLTIRRWDGTKWNSLSDCASNVDANTISCLTTDFSDFVLFGQPEAPPTPTTPPVAYETPSYDSPSYGSPSYNSPSYGSPSYGTPSYGTPSTSAASSDINKDGKTNVFDLSIMLRSWNKSGSGDLNKDGKVNVFDLSILLRGWSK